MTKQELLGKLAQKFHKVQIPQEQRKEDGITWYVVGVYEKNGDRMVRRNIGFYVENEGTANEAAYWLNSDPVTTPTAPVTFAQQVTDYLNNKIKAGVVVGAIVESVSQNPANAVVKVYIRKSGGIIEQRALVYQKGTTLVHEFIV